MPASLLAVDAPLPNKLSGAPASLFHLSLQACLSLLCITFAPPEHSLKSPVIADAPWESCFIFSTYLVLLLLLVCSLNVFKIAPPPRENFTRLGHHAFPGSEDKPAFIMASVLEGIQHGIPLGIPGAGPP